MTSKSKKFLKVIDGLRAWNLTASSNNQKPGIDIKEILKSDHFHLGAVRHILHSYFRLPSMAFLINLPAWPLTLFSEYWLLEPKMEALNCTNNLFNYF